MIDAGAAGPTTTGLRRFRPGCVVDAPGALTDIEAAAAMSAQGLALPQARGGYGARLGARLAVQEARLGLPDGRLQILVFATETPRAIFGLWA